MGGEARRSAAAVPGAVPAAGAGRTVPGAGARTRGLFKSRGRWGGRGGSRGRRRRARGSGCSGTAARSALRSSARGRPRLSRHGSARHGQPSPASPGPPQPPRLGPRWSPLPRSAGEPRVGAAAGARPAAEVRGAAGGGRLGSARRGSEGAARPASAGRRRSGAPRAGFPHPSHDNCFGSFYPSPVPCCPGGAGRCPPGRSGRAPTLGTLRLLWSDFSGDRSSRGGAFCNGKLVWGGFRKRRYYAELQQGDP